MTAAVHPDGSPPEFSRMVDVRHLPAGPLHLAADAAERAALAARFSLIAIDALDATVTFDHDATAVTAQGRLTAAIIQQCAISGEDLPVAIDEPLALRFVHEDTAVPPKPDEEIELEVEVLDDILFTGTAFDLGEAIAQSLALAIDPYATGPDADRVRREYGLDAPDPAGPFAALAALKQASAKKDT